MRLTDLERGLVEAMTEKQALGLAKQWFWDNPVELYQLPY